jgi:hypothetical protein
MEMAMAARQQQDARKGGSQPPRTGGSSGSAFRDRQRKN